MSEQTIECPLAASLLIHIHCSREPVPNIDAPAVQGELSRLGVAGAIVLTGKATFESTPLGTAWVSAICNTKIPRQVFVYEQGKILT